MSAKSKKVRIEVTHPHIQESTLQGLSRFNLIMGFLHLIQGIFMWVVSNIKRTPSSPITSPLTGPR